MAGCALCTQHPSNQHVTCGGVRGQFSYDLSPIQIIVSEQSRPWYHFVTTTSAIVGGVFTVAGIVDGLVHTGASMAKKLDLGEQG